MNEAKILRIECSEHGVLIEEKVYCSHDSESSATKVADAHRTSYGANCEAMLTMFLDDEESYRSRLLPPVQYVPLTGWRLCPSGAIVKWDEASFENAVGCDHSEEEHIVLWVVKT